MKASPHVVHLHLGNALRHILLLTLIAALSGPTTAAGATHTISYSNGVDPDIVVCDGDLADVDPDVDEIEVHFTLADGVNDDWVANGIILATTTDPTGATLVVTETTIQNITGNQIIAAHIIVDHDFAPFVTLTTDYIAHVDGSFDKVGGGPLGDYIFDFQATMTGIGLGGMNFAGGPFPMGPIPFDWTGLPTHQDTIINQRQTFIFYMDELDNTINLFNSATILPIGTVAVEEVEWSTIKQLFR